MTRQTLKKPLIYAGLLAVVGWFASQGCFPLNQPVVPASTLTPCPVDTNGQPVCNSPQK